MNASVNKSVVEDRDWVRKMAEAEDRVDCVSVGGLAQDLAMTRACWPQEPPRVLGHLIQLARRAKGFTVEKLAEAASVPLRDVVALEGDELVIPTERTVTRIAETLKLSSQRLLELAGLKASEQADLAEAAVRFKARCESTEKLSPAEEQALGEFARVLAEVPNKPSPTESISNP